MNKRICFVIDELSRGGKERQLLELVKGLIVTKELKPEEILLISFFKDGALDKYFIELGIQFDYAIRGYKYDVRPLIKFYNTLKKFNPDVIHVWDAMTSILTLPCAKILKASFVNGSIRNAAPPKRFSSAWIIMKLVFPFSQYKLANSLEGLKSRGLTESDRNICIRNGFDNNRTTEVISPEEIHKRFSITTKYIVGMVSNFAPRKDYATYLKAAKNIVGLREDVTFLCIGDGQKQEEYIAELKGNEKELIKFLGRREEIESLVNTFDIGVLASNTTGYGEGISNSLMEYMAFGKPLVATDSGGTKELVVHNETGFIIDAFDVESLQNYLIELLDDSQKRSEFGTAGKKRIDENFSMQRMVKDYTELYSRI